MSRGEDAAIRAVLYDIDGVLVPEGELYFSERYSRDHDISVEKLAPFFLDEFIDCLVGKKDIKEELTRHLRGWGWMGSVDELLSYWFEAERRTDKRLLAHIGELRARGVKCFIASHQERNRAEFLLDQVGLRGSFDGAYFSCYVGRLKDEPEFYERVFETAGFEPRETMFWDDNLQNVATASEFGLISRHYRDYDGYIADMRGRGM